MNKYKPILINLFHIIIVASLICSLAKNLQYGNDGLKKISYIFVLLMVCYHTYRIYEKLNTDNYIKI
jgi:hypothetical protein